MLMLKEQIIKDNSSIFLNFMEFAEEITINDQVYFAIVDNSFDVLSSGSLQTLANAASLGLVQADKVVYIKQQNCTFVPSERIELNKESYMIDDIKEDFGILRLTLNRIFA